VALSVATATWLPASGASAAPPLVLNRTVVLQDLGLTAVVMSDAVEQPLPPPTVYTYVRTEGGVSEKVDLYDPVELWRRSQHAAAWRSDSGTALQLATVSSLPPVVPGLPHAELKTIETALRRAEEAPVAASTEALATWASAFSGVAGARVSAVSRCPPRFSELWETEFPGTPRLCGFVFRFNLRSIGMTHAPDRLYAVLLTVPDGDGAAAGRSLLLNRFLAQIGPTTGRTVPRPDQGGATGERTNATGSAGSNLEESRRKAAESIRNMRGWSFVSTDHFVVLTNLDARRRGLVRELQARLESIRTAFERLLPPVRPIEDVSIVRVFATSAEYEAYVPPEQRWTGGIWVPARQELVIRPADDDNRAEQRERILATASHEAFHQYLHYAFDRVPTPAWFNEGHAEFFEPTSIDRTGRIEIPEKPRLVDILQRLCGRNGENLNLGAFTALSYDQFYAADAKQREANYALAWGLVYYLRKAAPEARSTGHAEIIPSAIAALRTGKDPNAATAAAFDRVEFARLQADFADFWSSTRRRRDAQRFDIFAATP
jgi:hypothetical protein